MPGPPLKQSVPWRTSCWRKCLMGAGGFGANSNDEGGETLFVGMVSPSPGSEEEAEQDRQSSCMVLSELQVSTEPLSEQIHRSLQHCRVTEAVTAGHDYLVISVPLGISV